jgi:8-hydroxy-5-deazaflavin:NADPH oxidoreductase
VTACAVDISLQEPCRKKASLELVRDLGLRALDAGPLANAIALESLTPVLIHLNRTYGSREAGIVFTNLPSPSPR